jgi:putative spermidine/putrescine transport system substrate-binding protein
MNRRGRWFAVTLGVLSLLGLALVGALGGSAEAGQALVVSTWGGNWKDVLQKSVAERFTKETGIPVEFEVGGTIKRLADARVNKDNPLVDVTLTTTHVGRLYISGGLFEKLDTDKLPNAKELFKEAIRSPSHLGLWAYVYTIVYRPDKVPVQIAKWGDLWNPALKGKIAMPDFDPSHIITVSALLSGGNEFTWQKGSDLLLKLKPNIAAFFGTDAQSQDLMKTGEAPVQVMLSANGIHVLRQGIKVTLVNPTDVGGIVGIDSVGIMKGTKKLDAAYKFVNIALARETQAEIVRTLGVGPTNRQASVPPELKGVAGVFTSPEEWTKYAYIMDDEQRAKTLDAWKEWFNANIVKK